MTYVVGACFDLRVQSMLVLVPERRIADQQNVEDNTCGVFRVSEGKRVWHVFRVCGCVCGCVRVVDVVRSRQHLIAKIFQAHNQAYRTHAKNVHIHRTYEDDNVDISMSRRYFSDFHGRGSDFVSGWWSCRGGWTRFVERRNVLADISYTFCLSEQFDTHRQM